MNLNLTQAQMERPHAQWWSLAVRESSICKLDAIVLIEVSRGAHSSHSLFPPPPPPAVSLLDSREFRPHCQHSSAAPDR